MYVIRFSDGRRFFALTHGGLAHTIDVACHGCWASVGSPSVTKLKAYKVPRRLDHLCSSPGIVSSQAGTLPYTRGGLVLAGISLVMGTSPRNAHRQTADRLRLVLAGVLRLRPPFILSSRLCRWYAISKLEYIYAAMPPSSTNLRIIQ